MRKIKYIMVLFLILLTSGCFEKTSTEKIDIKVSAYPIEYITSNLYSENATITSIYPNNMDKDYVVSDKLLNDYSSTNLFIFNGNESKENDYVYTMFNSNKKLKIIDATASLSYQNKIEELWLDPMNCLTMANNIKKGFKEYINAAYISNKIDTNYDDLKIKLIQLEADYREMSNRANGKNIVVGDDLFLYLKKYDINVISLEESKNYSKKSLYAAENLMKSKEVKTLYIRKGQELTDNMKELKEKYNLEVIELNDLYTLSEDDRKANKDYFTLMYENLDLLKQQLYD
mgnify:CR=1 FL=1